VDLLKPVNSRAEIPAVEKQNIKKRRNVHLEHKPSDEMDLLISEINASDLGWKADTCKYTKTNPLYGKDCHKTNLAQTNDNSLLDLDVEVEGVQTDGFGDMSNDKFKAALTKAQKWQKQYSNYLEIQDADLPDSYDFRNIDGYDFTSKFRDQGHCGSCYTISFT